MPIPTNILINSTLVSECQRSDKNLKPLWAPFCRMPGHGPGYGQVMVVRLDGGPTGWDVGKADHYRSDPAY